jgi:hypothetical protein
MQMSLLLWVGRSEIIKFIAFRLPGAGQILYKNLKILGLNWFTLDNSRHRLLTIFNNERATERLAKSKGRLI